MTRLTFGKLSVAAVLMLGAAAPAAPADTQTTVAPDAKPTLSVCADPGNLPYSNEARQGFENRLATVLAGDFNAELKYFWFAEHRSFFRRTLLDGLCDVVISAPVGLSIVVTTKPYFASTYVAVTRASDTRRFASFDDAWLATARIGLQLVGKEGATTPPAMALARRGDNQHITGFEMWDDPEHPNPQGKIIDAVAAGQIDVAFVWGPFAGYFAKAYGDQLRVQPILSDSKDPDLKFVFPMAMAVRKSDTALRDRLQAALDRHATEIAAILNSYGIPTVPLPAVQAAAAAEPPRSPLNH